MDALSYLSTGLAPPAAWREAKLAALEQAAKPKAEVELVVVPALKQLVIGAAELPQLSTTSPAEWRKRVQSLAEEKRGPRQ